MKPLLLALLLTFGSLSANGQTDVPDCQFTATFTSATTGASFNNQTSAGATPCVKWRVAYFADGLTSPVSIQLEGANDSNGIAGVYAAIAQANVYEGSNPLTDPNQATAAMTAYYPWIRLNVTAFTPAGGAPHQIIARVYGYKGTSANARALYYQTVDNAAIALPQEPALNFTGAGASCADNPGATRTDCTISGGLSACSTTPPTTGAHESCYDTAGAIWTCVGTCTVPTDWVPAALSAIPGIGLAFFKDDTTPPRPLNDAINVNAVESLFTTPVTTAEHTDTITTTSTTTVMGQTYLYSTPLGLTSIPSGIWLWNTYAGVNSVAAGRISTLLQTMDVVTNWTVDHAAYTLTTSACGAGSCTATANGGAAPFKIAACPGATLCIVASADPTLASFLLTPAGLYQITARTSDSIVTIAVPASYVAETTVAYSTFIRQFSVATARITNTGTLTAGDCLFCILYTTQTVQPAIAGLTVNSSLADMLFATSATASTTNVYYTHNGTARYSNFVTPIPGAASVTTRTWSYAYRGLYQSGPVGFAASFPATNAPAPTANAVTDPAGVLEWPCYTGGGCVATWTAAPYAWWGFLLPTGYVSSSAISYTIESRSTDSTAGHYAILTPSWGCISTAATDGPSWTPISPVNILGAGTTARVVTTGTITPTCAAGNLALVKFSIDTNTNAMTGPFDLIAVTFSVQGGL